VKDRYIYIVEADYHSIENQRVLDNSYNINGFLTPNVCDCVVGIIKGKKITAMFHFMRGQDPEILKELIINDFKNDQKIEITLLGGSIYNVFMPRRAKNRDITFFRTIQNSPHEKVSFESVKYLVQNNKKNKDFFKVKVDQDLDKYIDFIDANILGDIKNEPKFFTLNLDAIDNYIKTTNFYVTSELDPNKRGITKVEFKVQSIMDTVGAQNLSVVIRAIEETRLFNKNEVKHYFIENNSTVIYSFKEKSYTIIENENLEDSYPHEVIDETEVKKKYYNIGNTYVAYGLPNLPLYVKPLNQQSLCKTLAYSSDEEDKNDVSREKMIENEARVTLGIKESKENHMTRKIASFCKIASSFLRITFSGIAIATLLYKDYITAIISGACCLLSHILSRLSSHVLSKLPMTKDNKHYMALLKLTKYNNEDSAILDNSKNKIIESSFVERENNRYFSLQHSNVIG
jgi:hypothetical protein